MEILYQDERIFLAAESLFHRTHYSDSPPPRRLRANYYWNTIKHIIYVRSVDWSVGQARCSVFLSLSSSSHTRSGGCCSPRYSPINRSVIFGAFERNTAADNTRAPCRTLLDSSRTKKKCGATASITRRTSLRNTEIVGDETTMMMIIPPGTGMRAHNDEVDDDASERRPGTRR